MALPPKGDPRRPLHLAIRSTRVLGIVCLLFGMCITMPIVLRGMRFGVRAGRMPVWAALSGAVYFVPGTLFMLCSVFLGQRRYWAVVLSIVLSSIVGLLSLVFAVGVVAAVLTLSDAPVFVVIPLAIFVLFVLAIGQLIYHLGKSFEAIKYPPFGLEFHGFEPLPAVPVPPLTVTGPFEASLAETPQRPPNSADSRDTTYGPAPDR